MLIFFLSILLTDSRVGEVSPIPQENNATSTKKLQESPRIVETKGILPEVFKKIAWCESKNIQLNRDGTVHRGVQNPQDVGKYQINEGYHLQASQALGIDIYTVEGNTAYAYILYKANGTRDWNWSKWCWDDQTVSSSTWSLRFKENL